VTDIVAAHDADTGQVLAYGAALEAVSEHPLARAILKRAQENKIDVAPTQNFTALSGMGARALLGQKLCLIGNRLLMQKENISTLQLDGAAERLAGEGKTVVYVACEKKAVGLIALADVPKPSAVKAIASLKERGLKVAMVTGDNMGTARAIARHLGIDRVLAEVLPGNKADEIRKLQSAGEVVAMVGDGINDAPALEQADLGIAVSRASDLAREAADIILLKSEIEAVPEALGLARATLRTIKQNLFWAFFYNALGVPLAALGFISPILCAAAMGVSDLIVIGNALRLLRWR
jgi:Cu+-exporting ATPase